VRKIAREGTTAGKDLGELHKPGPSKAGRGCIYNLFASQLLRKPGGSFEGDELTLGKQQGVTTQTKRKLFGSFYLGLKQRARREKTLRAPNLTCHRTSERRSRKKRKGLTVTAYKRRFQ